MDILNWSTTMPLLKVTADAKTTWMTCCALHNWLLKIDGLDTKWNGTIGMHDSDDVSNNLPPFVSWNWGRRKFGGTD
jgi:hypothetical protein